MGNADLWAIGSANEGTVTGPVKEASPGFQTSGEIQEHQVPFGGFCLDCSHYIAQVDLGLSSSYLSWTRAPLASASCILHVWLEF